MGDKLPPEYFELVRDALAEEVQVKKRRVEHGNDSPPVVVSISSSDDGQDSPTEEDQSEEEDYDSDEFEDVVTEDNGNQGVDVSLNIDSSSPRKSSSRSVSKAAIVDPKTRQFRKFFHMFYLVAMMLHYYLRNEWLNDPKLQGKLSDLVPDKVLINLSPERDEELPLRSTRKLLDALKACMKLWIKHCKVINGKDDGLYMWRWDWLSNGAGRLQKPLTQRQFRNILTKGAPMSRKIAAEGFVAMLRGCGLNARLVVSLQPPDFTNLKSFVAADSNSKDTDAQDTNKFEYPLFWCEVWDKFAKSWINIDPICKEVIEQIRYKSKLEPTGKYAKFNQLRYVIAFDRKKGCKDVTRRYAAGYNAKILKRRITRDQAGLAWYNTVIGAFHRRKRTKIDDYEDEYFKKRDEMEGIPNNIADLKNHPYYAIEKDLKQNEILRPGCVQCGFLRLKSTKKHNLSTIKVYKRSDILQCFSARNWYMQGRILKTGCMPAKIIKVKEFNTGEQTTERLYHYDDTEPYVPPVVDSEGNIPINAYGNIDVYKPWMIPKGCVLIESNCAIKAAAFIGIPFAKAVTGFKFEKSRGAKTRSAKPRITGVVVETQYCEAVCSMIEGIHYLAAQELKEERELQVLKSWAKLLAQLRVKNRLNERHGTIEDNEVSEEEPKTEDLPESGGFIIEETTDIIPDQSNPFAHEEETRGFFDQDISTEAIDNYNSSERSKVENYEDPNSATSSKRNSKEAEIADEYVLFMEELNENDSDHIDNK
ncbi:Rad4p Ecym_7223 [Eremothecium cymbalariae DBVPG|uniref:Rad4 beta-hairpin domain-containing protein n=1 Tax=Eremothecium cymbalariae (strain CBS 270.75 / DBVPG 7215 / KCTC 17166 / NRRL Y-17582) TaxID=931890 RepID=G8JW54_ERECY|nr:hypothetical protein Ecym_7223 [Eremothecium cymbalariae DBVPG\